MISSDLWRMRVNQCFSSCVFCTVLGAEETSTTMVLATRRGMAALYRRHTEDLTAITAIVTRRLLLLSVRQQRAMWVRHRSHVFFSEIVSCWKDEEWKRNFRIGRPTFNFLCIQLSCVLQRREVVRKPLSVQEKVAITIWRLGTNVEYRSLAHLFGVDLSTVCVTVREVCTAIVNILFQRYIRIPTGEAAQTVVDGFFHTWGFPQCFGAIDGSHIPILSPTDNPLDYFNRKGWHSIVLQALVDHEYKFMNTNVGWPGSVHDARILANSKVYVKGESGDLVPRGMRCINGVDMPIVILGDPAYLLLPWLMKPYPATGSVSRKQKKFNYQLSRARMVVECAFGRLKGRWRCLMKRNDSDLAFVPTIVNACCVLHNLCEVHGDGFDDDWLSEEEEVPAGPSSSASTASLQSATCNVIRDALCDYFDA